MIDQGHSLAVGATGASLVLIWCDLCPDNDVVSGILKGEINNLNAITPGNTFHFQISYSAAAALTLAILNIIFSFCLHCKVFTHQITA